MSLARSTTTSSSARPGERTATARVLEPVSSKRSAPRAVNRREAVSGAVGVFPHPIAKAGNSATRKRLASLSTGSAIDSWFLGFMIQPPRSPVQNLNKPVETVADSAWVASVMRGHRSGALYNWRNSHEQVMLRAVLFDLYETLVTESLTRPAGVSSLAS